MIHSAHTYSLLILLTGLVVIASLLLKAGLRRLHIPGLVGFIALGFVLRVLDVQWNILSGEAEYVFYLLNTGRAGALLIGLSMVPRAEIAMIIMHRGGQMGDWAVPPALFSGIVLICAVTAIVTPWVLSGLLNRFPQKTE